MATLLFTAVGTLIGGPIGGALGALAGQQIDMAVLGPKTRQGPRLKDLAVQTSSYGATLPRHYGRMRAAGSVIWATELRESREKSGGGKGRPKTVTYSYSSSFAVALASRPIRAIGRIWADGNLLRGAAGDLKAAGELRLHLGHGDQEPDPLIAAAEGERCPAHRGTAYAVFEDLALADFGNRIPSLSFEIIADDSAVALGEVLADALPDAEVTGLDDLVIGYSVEGGEASTLVEAIGEIAPLACLADAGVLRIAGSPPAIPPALLPASLATGRGEDGHDEPALAIQREPARSRPDIALRYYDVDRDFQPGLQRAAGRSGLGAPRVVEFTAALRADAARTIASGLTRRLAVAPETAICRIASADARFAPGRTVALGGERGLWQVESWELDPEGIELGLRRIATASASGAAADPGRANPPPDLIAAPTILAAFELPWDGVGAANDRRVYAAVSSASPGWNGAQLFVERADGALEPLAASGRARATLGVVAAPLAPASATVLDLSQTVDVDLAAADLALTGASLAHLAAGANRALIGAELVQFAAAEAIDAGRWRLSGLLRGRGGTEWAVAGHGADETFVLLDDALIALDAMAIGDPAQARIAALGLGDDVPASTAIGFPGISLLPPSPVHGRIQPALSGGLALGWVRRARGAWQWRDESDAPLVEQTQAYRVVFSDTGGSVAEWETSEPSLSLDPVTVATLHVLAPDGAFAVRQRGDFGLSRPLLLGPLL